MSTFKKVVSLVLCFVMLLGIAVPAAIAADNTAETTETSHTGSESVIDSLATLDARDGHYVYFGMDFYEKDADGEYTLTDHYVEPGQTLRAEFFLKSSLYFGSGNIYLIFDRNFFDI
ncbi:MAG: hypothetical protein IJO36_00005, partial [Clostridia bacterium]|nr:hypothetical protein [Clostridia bacterium]